MTGLRYEGEGGLVWWSQGDEARLSEASAGGAEREIARCTRVREGEAAAAAAHGEDH
jgi:membrane-bound inhibitor of C-type lysozyme